MNDAAGWARRVAASLTSDEEIPRQHRWDRPLGGSVCLCDKPILQHISSSLLFLNLITVL